MMTGASNGKEEVPLLKGKSFNPGQVIQPRASHSTQSHDVEPHASDDNRD